jgi:hypothetical protein
MRGVVRGRLKKEDKGGRQMRLYQNGLAAAACAVVVIGTAALSLAQAPSKQAKIARAMQAAPESISKNATIVDGDGTVLRSGSNGWHCHPAAGPRSEYQMCNDEVWMRLMTAIVNKTDFRTDRVWYFIHARRRRCC